MEEAKVIGTVLERIDMVQKGLYTDEEAKALLLDSLKQLENLKFESKEFILFLKAQCNYFIAKHESIFEKKKEHLMLAEEQIEAAMDKNGGPGYEDYESLSNYVMYLAVRILIEKNKLRI